MLTAKARISKRIRLPPSLPVPFGRCRLASCSPLPSPLPLKINRDAFHNARDLNFHSGRPRPRCKFQGYTEIQTVLPVYLLPRVSPTRWWKINRAALHIVGKVSAARIKRPGTR